MSRRNPPLRWNLPDVVHPTTTICFQIPVPSDRFYIAAFRGALYALAYQMNWQRDDAHTAKEVAAVWLDIFDNLKLCDSDAPNAGYAGADGDELMIRQNPANPCELQSSVDGSTWCTFADFSLCLVPGGQPGSGTEQPPAAGGEACYRATMAATSKWLLPAPVNDGDVITISEAAGATNDGTVSGWRCPDGSYFFAGQCLGAYVFDAGDPLPAARHLSLIAEIDGTFYNVLPGTPFTVPGGIVNEQVTVQVNDSVLTDNSGEISFKVCLQNNQGLSWSSVVDFKTGMHGWTLANGTHVPGSGVQGVYVSNDDQTTLEVALMIAPTTITSVQWVAQRPAGSSANNLDRMDANPGGIYGSYHSTAGAPITVTETITRAAVTQFDMAMNLGETTSSGLYLEKLTITGTGVKPANLP